MLLQVGHHQFKLNDPALHLTTKSQFENVKNTIAHNLMAIWEFHILDNRHYKHQWWVTYLKALWSNALKILLCPKKYSSFVMPIILHYNMHL